MGIEHREPDPWKSRKPAKWNYQVVQNGGRMNAFLGAYPFGVQCHFDHGSKPCLNDMTKGDLPCKYCGVDDEPEWRGYTAIYTTEYLPRFVIITDDYLESVREIPIHAQVKISRGNGAKDPVILRADLWRTLPLPPSPERNAPVDLLPSLLRMWKIPALVKWHADHSTPARAVQVVPPAEVVPPAIAERMAPAALPTPDQIEAKLDEVLSNLVHKGKRMSRARPSTNGTHPPPSED